MQVYFCSHVMVTSVVLLRAPDHMCSVTIYLLSSFLLSAGLFLSLSLCFTQPHHCSFRLHIHQTHYLSERRKKGHDLGTWLVRQRDRKISRSAITVSPRTVTVSPRTVRSVTTHNFECHHAQQTKQQSESFWTHLTSPSHSSPSSLHLHQTHSLSERRKSVTGS